MGSYDDPSQAIPRHRPPALPSSSEPSTKPLPSSTKTKPRVLRDASPTKLSPPASAARTKKRPPLQPSVTHSSNPKASVNPAPQNAVPAESQAAPQAVAQDPPAHHTATVTLAAKSAQKVTP